MDRVIYESSKRITDHYGESIVQGKKRFHHGVDLGWRSDESQNIVYANCDGVVDTAVDGLDTMPVSSGSWGNYVLIRHPNGMYTRYCHLRKWSVKVKKGDSVNRNTQLGVIGESGAVTARHLHFEVQTGYSSSTRINPEPYLTKPVYDGSTPIPKPIGITGDITYQTYDNKKGIWLPEVVNDSDYAGNYGNDIGGVRAKPKYGEITIQAKVLGKEWLGKVSSNRYKTNDMSDGNSYAGLYGKKIDGIRIWCSRGYVLYRVRLINGKWLDWVDSRNSNGTGGNSYAGLYGIAIDAIQMK